MNLAALLHQRASLDPGRPALVETRRGRDRVVTYGELSRTVAGGASHLRALGLGRGAAVWIMQPVSVRLYEVMLAAFHAGMRVVLADPGGGPGFLRHVCDIVRPDAYCGPWAAQLLRWKTAPVRRTIPVSIITDGWLPGLVRWAPETSGGPPEDVPDDEPALITFTSGSTGMPKGAVRTHGLLVAQYRALQGPLELDGGGVDLVTLPVFVLANLAAGLTSVLADAGSDGPGRPRVDAVLAQCRRHGVDRCTASPAFFAALMASGKAMPAFRKVFTGGGPVFPDFVRKLAFALPGAGIHAVYGSTEAEPIAHASASEADGRNGVTAAGGGLAAGFPSPGTEVRVIRQAWGRPLGPMSAREWADVTLPPMVAGEIVVAGPQVLPGYLHGTGDRETKIHADGRVFHRTGDAGWIDADGRLWLLGRCSEMLPDPGCDGPPDPRLPNDVKCYPFAVECALRERFPGVRTAALEWRGKRCLAVGAPDDDPVIPAIRTAAADWGMDEVVILPGLPLDRRHRAKISYPELRNLLAARERR